MPRSRLASSSSVPGACRARPGSALPCRCLSRTGRRATGPANGRWPDACPRRRAPGTGCSVFATTFRTMRSMPRFSVVERAGDGQSARAPGGEVLREGWAVERADRHRCPVADDGVIARKRRPAGTLSGCVGRAQRCSRLLGEGVREGVLGDGREAELAAEAVVLPRGEGLSCRREHGREFPPACLRPLERGNRYLEARARVALLRSGSLGELVGDDRERFGAKGGHVRGHV